VTFAERLAHAFDKWNNPMKRRRKAISRHVIFLSVLVFVVGAAFTTTAQPPADHPGLLHALEDLRYARAHLQRPDGGQLEAQETRAIQAIQAAIFDIKKAYSNDGKTLPRDDDKYLNSNVLVDAQLDWPNRLRRAIELVNKAHSSVVQEQGDSSDDGFQRARRQALQDIDKARRNIEEAIHLVQ
jgi:hypothetical protein